MGCGQTVHSLARASIQLTPYTKCQACGKDVKKHGGWSELGAVFIFMLLMIYAAIVSGGFLLWTGMIIFAFYMTWWSWYSVPWEIVKPQRDLK